MQFFAEGEGEVTGAGADIEDGCQPQFSGQPDSFPAPVDVRAHGQEVVHEVITAGNFAEHLANAGTGFVDGHGDLCSDFQGPAMFCCRFMIVGVLLCEQEPPLVW